MTIRQVIAPFLQGGRLDDVQEQVLRSIELAPRGDWLGLLCPNQPYSRELWTTRIPKRNARALGDTSDKPFLLDLLDTAAEGSDPQDWLLLSNSDCLIHPDLYQDLRRYRGCALELGRQDVDKLPNLPGPWELPSVPLLDGLDGLALRAGFYADIRQHLPDFVLGEPWWDPCLSWCLREAVPVRRWLDRLYHLRHPQRWDPAHPGPAGAYNLALATRAAELGKIPQLSLGEGSNQTDSAAIVVSFGAEPRRRKALVRALREQLKQDLDCTTYLLDMLPEGVDCSIPQELLDKIRYRRLDLREEHRYLFLKESLYNAAWRWARREHEYTYFFFLDADIYAPRCDWLRQIRARLQQNPNRAVQGYRFISDPQDPDFRYGSLGAHYALQEHSDAEINPGLCWGLHRAVLERGDGFNPWCPEGAGDSTFVVEYLSHPQQVYEPSLLRFRWFQEIWRDLTFRAELDAVPIDLLHAYHGRAELRQRHPLRESFDQLPSLREFLQLDADGVLCWKQCSGPLYEAMQTWFLGGTTPQVKDPPSRHRSLQLRERPILGLPRRPQAGLGPTLAEPESSNHRVLFRPRQMLRREHPWSWCGNAQTDDAQQRIPVVSQGESYQLLLQPSNREGWMQAVLPLHPSWGGIELTGYRELRGQLSAAGFHVSLCLIWLDEEQEERRTEEVWLSDYLQQQQLRLPLSALGLPPAAANNARSLLWTFYFDPQESGPLEARLWNLVLLVDEPSVQLDPGGL